MWRVIPLEICFCVLHNKVQCLVIGELKVILFFLQMTTRMSTDRKTLKTSKNKSKGTGKYVVSSSVANQRIKRIRCSIRNLFSCASVDEELRTMFYCTYCGTLMSNSDFSRLVQRMYDMLGKSRDTAHCDMVTMCHITIVPYNVCRFYNGGPTCKVCGNIMPKSPLSVDVARHARAKYVARRCPQFVSHTEPTESLHDDVVHMLYLERRVSEEAGGYQEWSSADCGPVCSTMLG